MFVVLGVAGECICDFLVSKAEGSLQTFNDIVLVSSQQQSAKANERAAKAELRAIELDRELTRAKGDLVSKQGELATRLEAERRETRRLRMEADASEHDLASSKKLVLDEEVQIRQEQLKRFALEQSLAPRRTYFMGFEDGTSHLDLLKQFEGIEAVVEFNPDFEARRATSYLVSTLQAAKWKIARICPATTSVLDGVHILRFLGTNALEMQNAGTLSRDAARALWRFLRESHWTADENSASSGELLPKQVFIRVGYKPASYFDPQIAKNSIEEYERREGVEPDRYKGKNIKYFEEPYPVDVTTSQDCPTRSPL